jgi:asparagine synthase (glutamine-hydrolysing)
MCGIAGLFVVDGAPPTWSELASMANALRHRGPDELGGLRSERIGLAHTRLSIIDLSTGQQPIANEDNSLHVVFNGEIFNYIELREELLGRGHRFRTRSDTEVIVHAFEEWGDEAFGRFNGQFAIALWNDKTQELTLARDPYGVRPIYLLAHAGRIYFASEVKAIFAAAEVPRAIDATGLQECFTFWSTVPPQSIFHGVEELRPGWWRRYSRAGMKEAAHFHPRFPRSRDEEFRGTLDEAAEAVRAALERATKLRVLRADVDVGSYLSGGLDSSLVAALAQRETGRRLKTFSLRFADGEYDETKWQREMAERLGGEHSEIEVSRADIARVFPDVIRHAERPILRSAPAPLFLLSRLVRDRGIKVVLTGEGADEQLAGYDLFREAKVRRFWAKRPESKLRPRLLERLYPYLQRSPTAQKAMARQFFGRDLDKAHRADFAHGPRWQAAAALQRLFSPQMRGGEDPVARLMKDLPPEMTDWSPLARDQYLEIRTLLAGYILSSQGDRMLMAHSVEGRFPFLDREVGELAASLPAEYKLRVLDEKHVLKRAARELVPESILKRKKQPYRAPDALSFAGADWVEDLMSSKTGIFDDQAILALWNKVKSKKDESQLSNADNMALVGVISTQLLHRQFVVEKPVRVEAVEWTTRKEL